MSLATALQLHDGSVHDGVRYTSTLADPAVNERMPALRAGYSRAGRARRWLSNVVLLLCMIGLLSFAAPVEAQANWVDDLTGAVCGPDAHFTQPKKDAFGALGLEPRGLPDNLGTFLAQPHTAFEKYGMSGTHWTVFRGERGADKGSPLAAADDVCFPAEQYVSTFAANTTFSLAKVWTSGVIWLYESTSDLGGLLNDRLVPVVERVIEGGNGVPGLRDALYLEFLGVVLMLSAVSLFVVGVVQRRVTDFGSKALWLLGSVIIGCLILFNPSIMVRTSTAVVSAVSGAITTSVSGFATGGMDANNVCALPVTSTNSGSGGAFAGQATSIPRDERLSRMTSCSFWATFVYTPWVIGQFGVAPGDARLAGTEEVPVTHLGGNKRVQNLPFAQIDSQSLDYATQGQPDTTQIMATKAERFDTVTKLANEDGVLKSTWRGDGGVDRLMIAVAALVAAVCGLIIVARFSIEILKQQVAVITLALVAPLFLLLGVHPGFGRGIALKWASLLTGAILKQVLASALLGITLLLYAAIIQFGGADNNYAMTSVVLVVVTIVMWRHAKPLGSAVTPSWGSGFNVQAERGGRLSKINSGVLTGGFGSIAGLAAAAINGNAVGLKQSVTAVGSGVLRGGKAGATSLSTPSAAVRGLSEGQRSASSASAAVRDRKAKAEENRAAQERVDAHERDPHVYAQKVEAQERTQQQERREYERYKNDAGYVERLKEKHGGVVPEHLTSPASTEGTADSRAERLRRERAEAEEYRAQGHDPAYRAKVEAAHGGVIPRHLRDITPDSAPRPQQAEQPATPRPQQQEQTPRQEGTACPEREGARPQSGQPQRPQAPKAPRSGQPRRPGAGLPPRQGGDR